MGMAESGNRVLDDNPENSYCVKCFGDAVGAATREERDKIAHLFHRLVVFPDIEVKNYGPCSVCGGKCQTIRRRTP